MQNKITDWIYINDSNNSVRYALGEKSSNMVACIGINPSTATPNELDNTLKSVKRIATFNGFDGWLMYNVYPQRATDPTNLDKEANKELVNNNIELIKQSIQNLGVDTIWLAYGDLIESRDYLPFCMSSLFTKLRPLSLKWQIIGDPTQKGHPRHPLYKATKSKLVDFDVENYIAEILKPRITKYENK